MTVCTVFRVIKSLLSHDKRSETRRPPFSTSIQHSYGHVTGENGTRSKQYSWMSKMNENKIFLHVYVSLVAHVGYLVTFSTFT